MTKKVLTAKVVEEISEEVIGKVVAEPRFNPFPCSPKVAAVVAGLNRRQRRAYYSERLHGADEEQALRNIRARR